MVFTFILKFRNSSLNDSRPSCILNLRFKFRKDFGKNIGKKFWILIREFENPFQAEIKLISGIRSSLLRHQEWPNWLLSYEPFNIKFHDVKWRIGHHKYGINILDSWCLLIGLILYNYRLCNKFLFFYKMIYLHTDSIEIYGSFISPKLSSIIQAKLTYIRKLKVKYV